MNSRSSSSLEIHIHRPHLELCSMSQRCSYRQFKLVLVRRLAQGLSDDACCRNPELLSDTLILITLE